MNNKPVAWMHKTYFSNDLYEEDLVWSKVDENSIPLYTHPANLTDDEILEVEQQVNKELEAKGHGIMWFDDGIYVFARAILRKAQEK